MSTSLNTAPRGPRGYRGDDIPDVETLLIRALADLETTRALGAGGTGRPRDAPPAGPYDEHRAKARSLLHSFAMRHFSAQAEAIRRDAVIQHLADRSRDRMHFRRIVLASILGTLCGTGLANAVAAYGIRIVEAASAATRMSALLASLLGT